MTHFFYFWSFELKGVILDEGSSREWLYKSFSTKILYIPSISLSFKLQILDFQPQISWFLRTLDEENWWFLTRFSLKFYEIFTHEFHFLYRTWFYTQFSDSVFSEFDQFLYDFTSGSNYYNMNNDRLLLTCRLHSR